MKKITLLFLLFSSLLSYNSIAQSYKYHRFETYATQEEACEGNLSNAFQVKINISDLNTLLNVSGFYLINFRNTVLQSFK